VNLLHSRNEWSGMGFSVSVDDLEFQRVMDELSNAISPETLLEWADRIEDTVKQDCNARIRFKGKINDTGKFELEFPKTGDIDCVINAIRKHLDLMHPMTRKFYETVIETNETRKKATTS
jgi:hypothetical protein